MVLKQAGDSRLVTLAVATAVTPSDHIAVPAQEVTAATAVTLTTRQARPDKAVQAVAGLTTLTTPWAVLAVASVSMERVQAEPGARDTLTLASLVLAVLALCMAAGRPEQAQCASSGDRPAVSRLTPHKGGLYAYVGTH